ncbi:MAG: ComF family protein [Gammaproteobacteria bacterium]
MSGNNGTEIAGAWLRGALHALLPSSCALCGRAADAPVCAGCAARYLRACPRCPRCANPCAARDALHPCGACQAMRPAFDATVAAADYAAPLDQLVLQLKFGATLALANWCGAALKEAMLQRRAVPLPNVLCPVPLGRTRLASRGFNQALEIARPVASGLGIALRPRLAVRAIDTDAQSKLTRKDRRANIRNAFIVAPDALPLVRGQHIGIVDDVMTSGGTMHELAGVFKRFGAARVTCLVFARTPPR